MNAIQKACSFHQVHAVLKAHCMHNVRAVHSNWRFPLKATTA